MEFSIGTRLKELRKTKGMSITELAERSGVSTGLISQIERDLVAPSVVSLYDIAQALDTDISYFFSSSAPPGTRTQVSRQRAVPCRSRARV